MPREIEYEKIVEAVKEISLRANYKLPKDVVFAFQQALEREDSEVGKEVLRQILLKAESAEK